MINKMIKMIKEKQNNLNRREKSYGSVHVSTQSAVWAKCVSFSPHIYSPMAFLLHSG